MRDPLHGRFEDLLMEPSHILTPFQMAPSNVTKSASSVKAAMKAVASPAFQAVIIW
jgi:hypothetical protein